MWLGEDSGDGQQQAVTQKQQAQSPKGGTDIVGELFAADFEPRLAQPTGHHLDGADIARGSRIAGESQGARFPFDALAVHSHRVTGWRPLPGWGKLCLRKTELQGDCSRL